MGLVAEQQRELHGHGDEAEHRQGQRRRLLFAPGAPPSFQGGAQHPQQYEDAQGYQVGPGPEAPQSLQPIHEPGGAELAPQEHVQVIGHRRGIAVDLSRFRLQLRMQPRDTLLRQQRQETLRREASFLEGNVQIAFLQALWILAHDAVGAGGAEQQLITGANGDFGKDPPQRVIDRARVTAHLPSHIIGGTGDPRTENTFRRHGSRGLAIELDREVTVGIGARGHLIEHQYQIVIRIRR